MPSRDRRALWHAAITTTRPERLDALGADVPGDDRRDAIRIGWRHVEGGELLTRRLAYLRRLERDDADRRVAAETIADRRLHVRALPDEAMPEVERLRRAAPAAFDDAYRESLAEGQPFDVQRLIDGGVDLMAFRHDVLPEMRGCRGRAHDTTSLERCADAIEEREDLAAIANEHGLAATYLEDAVSAFAEDSDPARVAAVAARYVPFGLDAGAVAEGICETRLGAFEDDWGPYIDAARSLDAEASCVAEADALILGMEPLTAVAALVFLLLLLGAAVLIARTLRRRQDALKAQMDDAMKD